jgi:hypothetical protein
MCILISNRQINGLWLVGDYFTTESEKLQKVRVKVGMNHVTLD